MNFRGKVGMRGGRERVIKKVDAYIHTLWTGTIGWRRGTSAKLSTIIKQNKTKQKIKMVTFHPDKKKLPIPRID